MKEKEYEISIVMPAKDEEYTVKQSIERAKEAIAACGCSGEVLVVDNASVDRTAAVAAACGARVVRETRPGYGRALRCGFKAARGKYIFMGDCDTTYDFMDIKRMYPMLKDGRCEMVIGDRFAGGIMPGAMSLSHKIGVRVLSLLGRIKFRTDVMDFHCGLRGMTRIIYKKMQYHTTGMEFATEMIAQAAKRGVVIHQIPISLNKCDYSRKSKLRTVRDGLRHLGYIAFENGE